MMFFRVLLSQMRKLPRRPYNRFKERLQNERRYTRNIEWRMARR